MKTHYQRSASWLLGALMAGSSLATWAQASPQHPAHQAAAAGDRPMHGAMMDRMKAHHDQHFSQLKAKLQLSAEQEGAWAAFASAMTPPSRPATRPDWAEVMRLSTPERIDRIKALRQQRQSEMNAQMDRRGEAAKTFYGTLSAEQRKVFDDETRQHMAHWGESGGRRGHGHPGHRGG